jgi:hypothetical protein
VAILVDRRPERLQKVPEIRVESAVLASKWSDKKRTIGAAGNMNDQESSKSRKRRISAELRRRRLHEKAGKAKDGHESSDKRKDKDKPQISKHPCLNKECKGKASY